ncbi:phosphoglycerate dehydrogenase [Flavobacteriales bacterium]|nr:phosphoglycerate dehydrogenase [Flavobacteriales bacterium]
MRILFLDTVHEHLASHLTRMDHECIDGSNLSREELLPQIADYDGIVIRSRIKLDKDLLDAAKNLRFAARAGAGMENIDVDYAKMLGIQCFNAPEGNRDAVAEHAIGMLLSLFNHINTADMEVRMGLWQREENRGIELLGRTVGIVGYGNTGQALAKRMAGFGVLAYAYDKYEKGFGSDLIIETNMESIFQEAEVVSLHVPLTLETYHMVNDEFFEKLNNPIYLINTSRGAVVDTDALVRAIESGKVLGACLDVLEFEKFNFEQIENEEFPTALQYLIDSPKVILTPHVAGWTQESNAKIAHVLAEKIQMAYSEVH